MAITLLIMAAVVTMFANITGSVNRRRATIEMAGALRGVREALSRDMENATCPALPWRHPEANEGYLEIIEGPQNDYYPSAWLFDGTDSDNGVPEGIGSTTGIDLSISSLPGSNLRGASVSHDEEGRGLAVGSNEELPKLAPTDGRGLGDADDVLMLTVRNELQPFVGRIPQRSGGPEFEEIESPLAEVAWFALENPPERPGAETYAFGEAGYRTIYRRVLMIAPWLDYDINVDGTRTGPGVVSVLRDQLNEEHVPQAIAWLIAFQDQFDLSVRLEWDPLLPGSGSDASNEKGRWVLLANSLADLTKRENRFEHHGLTIVGADVRRRFPFAALSSGRNHTNGASVKFVSNPIAASPAPAQYEAITTGDGRVVGYEADPSESATDILESNRKYSSRPFVYLNENTLTPATARAVLDENGKVVRVVRGLVPLGGERRGDDVMLTDVMAFDLRVYDPGAPVYGYYPTGDLSEPADTLVAPGDPAWEIAYQEDASNGSIGGILQAQTPQLSTSYPFAYERQGAYVDLGYRLSFLVHTGGNQGKLVDQFVPASLEKWPDSAGLLTPTFFPHGWISLPGSPTEILRSTGYASYDTWSWHYENNGLDEDGDNFIDEGTDSFDSPGFYTNATGNIVSNTQFGPDDPGERETRPPYDTALRGLQATLRVYERDSLQIREVKVRESFVPE